MAIQNTIPIEAYLFGPRGEAVQFEVRSFSGTPSGGASFSTHVWTAGVEADPDSAIEAVPPVELNAAVVNVNNDQWNMWLEDNDEFYRLLAILAGYTPVVP